MLMNMLEDFPHLCTTISTNLTDSKAGSYTSKNILLLLETKQALCSVAAAPAQSQLKPEAKPSLAEAQPESLSDDSHILANSSSS